MIYNKFHYKNNHPNHRLSLCFVPYSHFSLSYLLLVDCFEVVSHWLVYQKTFLESSSYNELISIMIKLLKIYQKVNSRNENIETVHFILECKNSKFINNS